MLADGLLDQPLPLRDRSPGIGIEHLLFDGGMDRELLGETIGDLAPRPHGSVPEALITPEQLIDGGVVGFDQRDHVLLASSTRRLPARPTAARLPRHGRPRCRGFGGHRHTSSLCASAYPTAGTGKTCQSITEPEVTRPRAFGNQRTRASSPVADRYRKDTVLTLIALIARLFRSRDEFWDDDLDVDDPLAS